MARHAVDIPGHHLNTLDTPEPYGWLDEHAGSGGWGFLSRSGRAMDGNYHHVAVFGIKDQTIAVMFKLRFS